MYFEVPGLVGGGGVRQPQGYVAEQNASERVADGPHKLGSQSTGYIRPRELEHTIKSHLSTHARVHDHVRCYPEIIE